MNVLRDKIMFALFLKGLIIGFAIAAPVGPIGILCIQRSLQGGFKIGLMTGIGAALADGVYGLIAGFGLTVVSSLLIAQQFWIHLIGGIFLLYLGFKTFFAAPYDRSTKKNYEKSALHACVTSFLLTLSNPMTILSFITVFAGLGLGVNPNYDNAIVLILGITLGSTFWWLLLSGGVAFILHKRMSPYLMRIINWVSGAIILTFGLFALLR